MTTNDMCIGITGCLTSSGKHKNKISFILGPMAYPAICFVKIILLPFLFAFILLSCNRIKQKGHAIIDSATVIAKAKKDLLKERLFPGFDADISFGKVQGHINSYLWHDTKKKKVYFFSFDL